MSIDWSSDLDVRVGFMNDEHQKLIAIANEFHDAIELGQSQEQLVVTLDRLTDFTKEHFADEESEMDAHDYPAAPLHKGQHKELLVEIDRLRARQQAGEVALTAQVWNFLQTWLTEHIQHSDRRFGQWLLENHFAS